MVQPGQVFATVLGEVFEGYRLDLDAGISQLDRRRTFLHQAYCSGLYRMLSRAAHSQIFDRPRCLRLKSEMDSPRLSTLDHLSAPQCQDRCNSAHWTSRCAMEKTPSCSLGSRACWGLHKPSSRHHHLLSLRVQLRQIAKPFVELACLVSPLLGRCQGTVGQCQF